MLFKNLSFVILSFIGLVLVSYNTVELKPTDHLWSEKVSSDSLQITDGPYIFITTDSLIEKQITKGKLESKALALAAFPTQFKSEASSYDKVSKIAALSDIHGQYELTTTILKNNGIIDATYNWAYGDGHFVIVGDVFDRGAQVTELLWFLFKLEKQAEQAGGKLHYLLGNHEYMVLQNDLRYINKKYRQTERILQTPYNELFGTETILGRWLRSKATIVKIDDNLFVHGGISSKFIESGFNLEATNQTMRQSLLEVSTEPKWDSIYNKYYNSNSPIWYRGYFSEDFKTEQLKKLLRSLRVKHIVVGHTSQTRIESLFKNRLFAVDSSIKNGVSGELLLIEDGCYYRGTMDGQKIKIKK